jgi:hypothetical protein
MWSPFHIISYMVNFNRAYKTVNLIASKPTISVLVLMQKHTQLVLRFYHMTIGQYSHSERSVKVVSNYPYVRAVRTALRTGNENRPLVLEQCCNLDAFPEVNEGCAPHSASWHGSQILLASHSAKSFVYQTFVIVQQLIFVYLNQF